MGDLVAIATLVSFAAVIFREHIAQHAEERADRRSRHDWDAFRREMSR